MEETLKAILPLVTGDERFEATIVDHGSKRNLLAQLPADAGLATKSSPAPDGVFRVVNRIVVEELEAWFFGDVPALAKAFPGVSTTLGRQARYRDPDAVVGGTWEALFRVLQKAGHFPGTRHLPKIAVARRVSAHMTVSGNRSQSFQAFVAGLQALLA